VGKRKLLSWVCYIIFHLEEHKFDRKIKFVLIFTTLCHLQLACHYAHRERERERERRGERERERKREREKERERSHAQTRLKAAAAFPE
jgi:hypothetical protein